jgi:hypothetical protein
MGEVDVLGRGLGIARGVIMHDATKFIYSIENTRRYMRT